MTVLINRPRVPTSLPLQGVIGRDQSNNQNPFNFAAFLQSPLSGLKASLVVSSTWFAYVDEPNPGWISFLAVVGDRTVGPGSDDYDIRVTVNGAVICNYNVVVDDRAAAIAQKGHSIVGTFLNESLASAQIASLKFGYLPYDSLLIELKNNNPTNLDVVVSSIIWGRNTPTNGNRPIVPEKIVVGHDEIWHPSVNMYDYFADTAMPAGYSNHGLQKHFQQTASWETVVEHNGSGVLTMCAGGAQSSAGTQDCVMRVTIDGKEMIESFQVSDTQPTGKYIVGNKIIGGNPAIPRGISNDYVPYENQLKIEAIKGSSSVDLCVVYDYMPTGYA